MACVHEHHIVHSDIKPDNILVVKTEDGYCTGKIIDFDLGYFTYAPPEEIGGDQVYFSPETLLYSKGEEITPSTAMDVFSLGILFHEYWTGKRPGVGEDYDLVCEAVCDDAPVTFSTDLPGEVAILISRMLMKDPKDRPTAREALAILAKNDEPEEPEHVHEPEHEPVPIPVPAQAVVKEAPANVAEKPAGAAEKKARGFYKTKEFD